MKFSVITVAAFVFSITCGIAHAQTYQVAATEGSKDTTFQLTEIGRFVNGDGMLIAQDRKQLLHQRGMGQSYLTLTAVSAYDPMNPEKKVKGFEIEFFDNRQHGSTWQNNVSYTAEYHLAYIDLKEAVNLQTALRYMSQMATSWKGKDVGNKRIHFHGTDNYEFYFDQGVEDDKLKQQFTAYGGVISSPRVTLSKNEDVLEVATAIGDGTKWLDEH